MKRRTRCSWRSVAGAQKYASDSFQKAQDALQQSLKYQVQKPGQKPVITMAREACLRAEDARIIALRAERAEALEAERQAGVARENAEKQKAEEARMRAEDEARARRQAELDRLAAEQAKSEALTLAQNAQNDADTARQERAAAEQAKAEALQAKADADQARMAAEQARATRRSRSRQQLAAASWIKPRWRRPTRIVCAMKAEQDQAQLRQQLLDQFNSILQTRDTARGLDRQYVGCVVRYGPLYLEAGRAGEAGQGFRHHSGTSGAEDRGRRPHR